MISRALSREGIVVKHILDSGDSIETEVLEKQLLERYKLDNKQATLFNPRKTKKDLLDEAYKLRGKEIRRLVKRRLLFLISTISNIYPSNLFISPFI